MEVLIGATRRADFAGQAASAVGMVFGALKAGWDAVPKPLRDLLVTGLVADKTIKFLFGFDPAAALFKGATGLLQRGGTPANPLFVTDVAGDLTKGGVPGVGGVAGLSLATIGVIVAAAAASTYAFVNTYHGPQAMGAYTPTVGSAFSGGPPVAQGGRNIAEVLGQVYGFSPVGSATGATRDMDKAVWAPVVTATNRLAATMRDPKWLTTLQAIWHKQGDVTRAQLEVARADLANGRNLAKAAEFIGGAKGAGTGGPGQIRADIHDLKAALKTTYDPTETRAITKAIHELRDKLPKVSDNHRILAKAEKIATSTEATKNKIADLKGLLKDVDSKGLRGKLQDIISKVPKASDKTTRKVDDAGRKIDSTKTAVQSGARTNAAATRTGANTVTNGLQAMAAQIVAALYATQAIVNVTAADVTAAQTRRNRGGPSTGSAGGANRPGLGGPGSHGP